MDNEKIANLLEHVRDVLSHAYVRTLDDSEPFCGLWNAYEDVTGEPLVLDLPRYAD
jgi:hypothetical protein